MGSYGWRRQMTGVDSFWRFRWLFLWKLQR